MNVFIMQGQIDEMNSSIQDLESFMKESYLHKKETDNNSKKEIINQQINTIYKMLIMSTEYRNNFLDKNYNELFFQKIKKTTKAQIRNYLLAGPKYRKEANIFVKEYKLLEDEDKKIAHDLNLHIESLILVLNELIDILEIQLKILSSKKVEKNIFSGVKIKVENIVLGDFEKNLVKEEKIFGSFLKMLGSKNISEIEEYENYIIKHGVAQSGIKTGLGLNLFPETGISDLLSILPYSFSLIMLSMIANSKFNKEEFYKYSN